MNYRFKHNNLDISRPAVMGVLNLTPDSFYDGGKHFDEDAILSRVQEQIKEGMKVLDIGGQSSRPGAKAVTEAEELTRIWKIFTSIRTEFPDLIISIDTFYSSIARKTLAGGADIINDITGGSDPLMMDTVAEFDAGYIIMHMQGTPLTMQNDPVYTDVIGEVSAFLRKKAAEAEHAGISKIFIDPGFGFGKSVEDNYTLLAGLGEFTRSGLPVVCGLSRKSMITKVLGTDPATSLNGTTVLNTIALIKGACLLRVHDVREASEAIKIFHFASHVNTIPA